MTPSAPAPRMPATQGGRNVSRSIRSEISIAPRSRPLAGWLWPG